MVRTPWCPGIQVQKTRDIPGFFLVGRRTTPMESCASAAASYRGRRSIGRADGGPSWCGGLLCRPHTPAAAPRPTRVGKPPRASPPRARAGPWSTRVAPSCCLFPPRSLRVRHARFVAGHILCHARRPLRPQPRQRRPLLSPRRVATAVFTWEFPAGDYYRATVVVAWRVAASRRRPHQAAAVALARRWWGLHASTPPAAITMAARALGTRPAATAGAAPVTRPRRTRRTPERVRAHGQPQTTARGDCTSAQPTGGHPPGEVEHPAHAPRERPGQSPARRRRRRRAAPPATPPAPASGGSQMHAATVNMRGRERGGVQRRWTALQENSPGISRVVSPRFPGLMEEKTPLRRQSSALIIPAFPVYTWTQGAPGELSQPGILRILIRSQAATWQA